MKYLYHKPHVPNIFPRKKGEERAINDHHAKWEDKSTEIKNVREYTRIKMYSGTDLATDIANRRSVTSVLHEYNEVLYAWKTVKQAGVALHANRAEIRVFFTGVKRTKLFRILFESIEGPINVPAP